MGSTMTGQFFKAREEIAATINKFPPKKRLLTLFDKWTLKDVVAHLSGWDLFTLEAIKGLNKRKVPDWDGSVQEVNRASVTKRKGWTWEKIIDEFNALGNELHKELNKVDSGDWERKIWPNKSLTVEKLLKIDIHHCLKEHLGKIDRESKRQ